MSIATSDYWKDQRYTHLGNTGAGHEFTLCGWFFDAPNTEDDCPSEYFVNAASGPVTCPDCGAVIKHCRNRRIRESNPL